MPARPQKPNNRLRDIVVRAVVDQFVLKERKGQLVQALQRIEQAEVEVAGRLSGVGELFLEGSEFETLQDAFTADYLELKSRVEKDLSERTKGPAPVPSAPPAAPVRKKEG